MDNIITEFQNDDISSNVILNYLKKMTTKINNLINLNNNYNTYYINNGQGYGLKLMYISPTINFYGDSFTQANVWNTKLSTILGKTSNNLAVSGTCVELINNDVDNIAFNTVHAGRTTMVMYGVNDVRRTLGLYRYYHQYMSVLISAYCLIACPQNKFKKCRDFATKAGGTWANTPVNSCGSFTFNNGAYLQDTFNNVRYIFISVICGINLSYNWKVEVNGEVIGRYRITDTKAAYTTATYYGYGVLIDLGLNRASIDLKITNLIEYPTNGSSIYFNCVCCWNDVDQSLNTRNALILTINKHYALSESGETGDYTDEKRRLLNDCIKNTALTCIRHGLKLSVLSMSMANGCYGSDLLHPSNALYDMIAYNVIDHAIL